MDEYHAPALQYAAEQDAMLLTQPAHHDNPSYPSIPGTGAFAIPSNVPDGLPATLEDIPGASPLNPRPRRSRAKSRATRKGNA
ncbi:hypothetical protein VTJ04DRAFT_8803 [Mycothermus thermophilus]|uniref:uncharacterized protein n=1 Tax=Humicola insolens TaxID=85995 RepID=UPI00374394CB